MPSSAVQQEKTIDGIQRNLSDYMKWVAENSPSVHASVNETKERLRYTTGWHNPLFNGILNADFTAWSNLEKEIAFFKEKQLPFTWWVEPSNATDKHRAALEKHGFSNVGTYSGLAAPLNTFVYQAPIHDLITVSEVTSDEMLEMWAGIIAYCFNFNQELISGFFTVSRPYGPKTPFRHYLAYFNAVPVGAMTLFHNNGQAGIWNGAVLPDARKAGIGIALANTCMKEAKALKYETIQTILMAGQISPSLTENLGFQEICQLTPYTFKKG